MRPTILVDAAAFDAMLKVVPAEHRNSLNFTRLHTAYEKWLEADVSRMCTCCGVGFTPTSLISSRIATELNIDTTCLNCLAQQIQECNEGLVVMSASHVNSLTAPVDSVRDAVIQYLAERIVHEDDDRYAIMHDALKDPKGNHITDSVTKLLDYVDSTLPKF